MSTVIIEYDDLSKLHKGLEGNKAAKLQEYNYTQNEMKPVYRTVESDYNKNYPIDVQAGWYNMESIDALARKENVVDYMRKQGLPQSSINKVVKRNFEGSTKSINKTEVFEDIAKEILYNEDKSTDPQRAADRRRSNYSYQPIIEGGEIKNKQAYDNLDIREVQKRGKDGKMRTVYQLRTKASIGGTLNRLSNAPGGQAVHQMNYDFNRKMAPQGNYFQEELSQEKAPVNFLNPR